MRILILSREPKSYSTRRLREAARTRGHEPRIVNTLDCTMSVEGGKPDLFVIDTPIGEVDAVIPRIGASITFYGTAVVRQLEQMGVYTLNTAQAISITRDKLRCFQMLSRHRVAIPTTAFVRSREDVVPTVERLGGPPVVVKLIEGLEGVGVIHASTMETAFGIVETMQVARQNVLISKQPDESEQQIVRAIVVGGVVIASMSIVMQRNHRTGRLRPVAFADVELSAEARSAAERASQILGLSCAGVDLALRDDGVLLLDVSSTPDLEAIEIVTEKDIAGTIIQHVEEQVEFPEFDIEQRLLLDNGYGVSEFLVTPNTPIIGKAIDELDLGARAVQVLSIVRGSVTLPNPRGDVRISSGDIVLCYGKLDEIRQIHPPPSDLIPKRKRSAKSANAKASNAMAANAKSANAKSTNATSPSTTSGKAKKSKKAKSLDLDAPLRVNSPASTRGSPSRNDGENDV